MRTYTVRGFAAAALLGAGVATLGSAEAAVLSKVGLFGSESELPAGWTLSQTTTSPAGGGQAFVAEARIGDRKAGGGEHELGVGGGTDGASDFARTGFAWADGTTYGFKLELSGLQATWTMSDGVAAPTSVVFDFTAVEDFNALLFRLASTDAGAPPEPGDLVTVGNLVFNGAPVGDPDGLLDYTHRQDPSENRAVWLGLVAGLPSLADGFTLTGDLTFDWNDTVPQRSNLAMQIKGANYVDTTATSPVPVPAALPLFASAMAGLGFLGWRNRKAG